MRDILVLDEDLAIDIGPKGRNWDSEDQEWFYIDDGIWFISQGVLWDGATLAPDGKPDPNKPHYPILWLPSLLHDLGYMALTDYDDFPYSRKEVDKIFLLYMDKSGFKFKRFYYRMVRWFGGVFSDLGIWYRKTFNKRRLYPTHISCCEVKIIGY